MGIEPATTWLKMVLWPKTTKQELNKDIVLVELLSLVLQGTTENWHWQITTDYDSLITIYEYYLRQVQQTCTIYCKNNDNDNKRPLRNANKNSIITTMISISYISISKMECSYNA